MIVGAFLGGLMVFLQFWPHFQIVPKPPSEFETLSGRSANDHLRKVSESVHLHSSASAAIISQRTRLSGLTVRQGFSSKTASLIRRRNAGTVS
jgi:hypothetical protein